MNRFIAPVLIGMLLSQTIAASTHFSEATSWHAPPEKCENAGWIEEDSKWTPVLLSSVALIGTVTGYVALQQPGPVFRSMGAVLFAASPLLLFLALTSVPKYRFDFSDYIFCRIHANGIQSVVGFGKFGAWSFPDWFRTGCEMLVFKSYLIALACMSGFVSYSLSDWAVRDWRDYQDTRYWAHASMSALSGIFFVMMTYFALPSSESMTAVMAPLKNIVVITYEMMPSSNTTLEALSDVAGRIVAQTPRDEVIWRAISELDISSIAWLAGGCVAMIYVVNKFNRFERSLAGIEKKLLPGEDCAICHEPTVAEGLFCGHRFHPACIVGWALTGRNAGRACPVCCAEMVQQ